MLADLIEEFSPLCPACRTPDEVWRIGPAPGAELPAAAACEAILRCSNPACCREHPVLAGVPIVVADPAPVFENQLLAVLRSDELGEDLANLIGDNLDPGTPYNAFRQHLSSYGWDHYGEYDPEPAPTPGGAIPGSISRLLDAGMALLSNGFEPTTGTRVADLGCSVGRTVFDLAATGATVLGIDFYFGLIRAASRTRDTGRFRYSLRRNGLVFENREFGVPGASDGRAMFLHADAVDPPLPDQSFDLITSLNLLDAVGDPRGHLQAIRRLLTPGGQAIVATPYDWSAAATPVASWIGGHSSRNRCRGEGPELLRRLLAEDETVRGLRLTAEADGVPWHVRMHDRSLMEYRVHLLALMRDPGD